MFSSGNRPIRGGYEACATTGAELRKTEQFIQNAANPPRVHCDDPDISEVPLGSSSWDDHYSNGFPPGVIPPGGFPPEIFSGGSSFPGNDCYLGGFPPGGFPPGGFPTEMFSSGCPPGGFPPGGFPPGGFPPDGSREREPQPIMGEMKQFNMTQRQRDESHLTTLRELVAMDPKPVSCINDITTKGSYLVPTYDGGHMPMIGMVIEEAFRSTRFVPTEPKQRYLSCDVPEKSIPMPDLSSCYDHLIDLRRQRGTDNVVELCKLPTTDGGSTEFIVFIDSVICPVPLKVIEKKIVELETTLRGEKPKIVMQNDPGYPDID